MREPGYRLGLLLVTGSAVAWSLAGLFTRLLALDSWTMLAWRGLFGAIGIAAVALLIDSGAWRTFRRMGAAGWLYALVSAVGMVCYITALRQTSVAHVAVIYATAPFVAAALGWWWLDERPTPSATAASLAALVGIAIMVGLGTDGRLAGDLLAFGMTSCMAVMMVMARRSRRGSALPAASLSALLSGLAAWPLGTPLAVSGHDLVVLAGFGLVNSAAGLALFTLGARLLPAVETALIGTLDAPLAPLWVWLAVGETPGPATLVGGTVVFVAVGLHIAAASARGRRRAA